MKTTLSIILFLLISVLDCIAAAQANLDLDLLRLMNQPKSATNSRSTISNDSINVIIDFEDEASLAACNVLALTEGVAVCRIAVKELHMLKNVPGIKSIQSKRNLYLNMKDARNLCNVDEIIEGIDLPRCYDGSGVTIGMIDVGFEVNHAAFLSDDNKSRVRYFVQLKEDPTENIEATSAEELALITTDDSTMFHGTHTTSIAAGGYSSKEYYGVAPNADIMMAAVDLSLSEDASILIGAKVLADKIKELGQPGVLNMSIGSTGSPHDSSNPVARFLNAIAAEVPFCISAGNDGHNERCVRLDFTEEETEKWVLAYGGKLMQYLSLWSADSREFSTEVFLYPKDKVDDLFGPIMTIDRNLQGEILQTDTDEDGEIFSDIMATYLEKAYLAAASEIYPGNDKYYNEIYFEFEKLPDEENKRIFLALKITGEPGMHIDCYAEGPSNIFYTSKSGNIRPWGQPTADGTISTLALGSDILSIGACDVEGDVTFFSSWGTYQIADQSLPLILAPGASTIAALSRYPVETEGFQYEYFNIIKDEMPYYYGPQGGTSMSSPFVAGTIALWMQADPNLTVPEIKEIITACAWKPESYFDGTQIKERYGQGVIDSYQGLKCILNNLSLPTSIQVIKPLIKLNGGIIEITTAASAQFVATLYDFSGRIVATSTSDLNVSNLPGGIYLLSICTANDMTTYKIKI